MITVNGYEIQPTIFPDGTQQVWKLPDSVFGSHEHIIYWKFESEKELITVHQLSDLLVKESHTAITLRLPYLPYCRQDKDICNDKTFGLHCFLEFLDQCLAIVKLQVFDPHSVELLEQYENVEIVLPCVDKLAYDYDVICFPDAGAAKKYKTSWPVVVGTKNRDQLTGHIVDYAVPALKPGLKVLVVDDICDGGATFCLLGDTLKSHGINADLYVSHGIFSRGVSELKKFYGKITATDSYDFWAFVTQFLPSIRELVMSRNGKLVIRPDSGTPNKILCGDPGSTVVAEQLGLVSCLGDIFGTTRNSMNCIKLDPHIGAIYGDSIDLKEQELILEGLLRNGYSTDNVVLGIGSYSYQYVTRDTFGFVCKATSRKTSAGTRHAIFKNPKTGGWKKSHRGLLYVADNFAVTEDATEEMAAGGWLRPVFRDGMLLVDVSFDTVRRRAECSF